MESKYLISKAKFSDLAGVSRSSISQACQKNGSLFDALDSRGLIDANHPKAKKYIVDCEQVKKECLSEDNIYYDDMSVREVVERFGTDVRFAEYVKAVKDIQSIERLRISNERKRSEVVPAEIFDLLGSELEKTFNTILGETSEKCAAMAHDNAKSKAEIFETEEYIRQQVGGDIKKFKAEMISRLLELKGKG